MLMWLWLLIPDSKLVINIDVNINMHVIMIVDSRFQISNQYWDEYQHTYQYWKMGSPRGLCPQTPTPSAGPDFFTLGPDAILILTPPPVHGPDAILILTPPPVHGPDAILILTPPPVHGPDACPPRCQKHKPSSRPPRAGLKPPQAVLEQGSSPSRTPQALLKPSSRRVKDSSSPP